MYGTARCSHWVGGLGGRTGRRALWENVGWASGFADRFFPHETRSGVASITSTTEIDTLIGSLTKDLAAAEAQKKTIAVRAAAKAEKKETERRAAEVLAAAKESESPFSLAKRLIAG